MEKLDDLMDEFMDDQSIIHFDESARRKLLFSSIRRLRLARRTRRQCGVPGCSDRSVRSSHTIQHNALSRIAVDGHVITPRISPPKGELLHRVLNGRRGRVVNGRDVLQKDAA